MGWSYDFWKGNFYPENMRSDLFLTEYSKHFDTVEVDNTFYRIPSEPTVARWNQQTPETFLFAVKFPRIITHIKMLKECYDEVERFLKTVSKLKPQLGPLLLQFPSTFGPEHIGTLADFLATLPNMYKYAVEIRNKKMLEPDFYSVLRENQTALAIVDSPSMPLLDELTASFAYVRWEGDRRKVKGTLGKTEFDRTKDVEAWTGRIVRILEEVENVFGYFSKFYSGNPTSDAEQLIRRIIDR